MINITEAFIGVALTSFMALVVFFFATLLMLEHPKDELSLRTPLIFLFYGAFGFIYATLIYANASGEIARRQKASFDRQMTIGNSLSEFVGVYGLIFAIPITILQFTGDETLSLVVFVMGLIGFSLYHILGFSILQRYLSRGPFSLLFLSLAALYVLVFLSAYWGQRDLHYLIAGVTLLTLGGVAALGVRGREFPHLKA